MKCSAASAVAPPMKCALWLLQCQQRILLSGSRNCATPQRGISVNVATRTRIPSQRGAGLVTIVVASDIGRGMYSIPFRVRALLDPTWRRAYGSATFPDRPEAPPLQQRSCDAAHT